MIFCLLLSYFLQSESAIYYLISMGFYGDSYFSERYMKAREYLKLARSFNSVLTGISPVMGAIAMRQYDLLFLFLLFLVGFLGHTYGFVLNDIIDYRIDRSSREIRDRPLVSGTISLTNAWIFALLSMILAFVIALYLAYSTNRFFPLVILVVSAFFITLYDFTSKKFPFMDIFVALGVFFLVLYGSLTINPQLSEIPLIAWLVCILAATQVLFMQIVAGGMKDIENDYNKGARTLAIQLGVRVKEGILYVSPGFKAVSYLIQAVDICIVFLPFFLISGFASDTLFQYVQWITLVGISGVIFYLSYRLLSMNEFKRFQARRYIGLHYVTNFSLVPVMLMSLNVWSVLLVFFPILGFVLSNIILHGTVLQPKTM